VVGKLKKGGSDRVKNINQAGRGTNRKSKKKRSRCWGTAKRKLSKSAPLLKVRKVEKWENGETVHWGWRVGKKQSATGRT